MNHVYIESRILESMFIGVCECVEGELGWSQEEGEERAGHRQQWRERREDSCVWISKKEKGFHTLTDSIAVTLILCEIHVMLNIVTRNQSIKKYLSFTTKNRQKNWHTSTYCSSESISEYKTIEISIYRHSGLYSVSVCCCLIMPSEQRPSQHLYNLRT